MEFVVEGVESKQCIYINANDCPKDQLPPAEIEWKKEKVEDSGLIISPPKLLSTYD